MKNCKIKTSLLGPDINRFRSMHAEKCFTRNFKSLTRSYILTYDFSRLFFYITIFNSLPISNLMYLEYGLLNTLKLQEKNIIFGYFFIRLNYSFFMYTEP